jgi:PAS domain S-box-containing protein
MEKDVTAEQLRHLVDRLSDGLILFDRDGTCLYLNAEAERIVGTRCLDGVGKHIGEVVPGAMGSVVEGARDRLLAGEEVLVVPSYFTQGRWFEILGRPLGGDFVVHFHDITERLQAESARHQLEERFQILVNGLKDYSVVMLDPKGIIVTWNGGAERATGYSASETLGRSYESLLSPEDVASGEPRRRLEVAVKDGSYTAERWFPRKDGSQFLARVNYTRLEDRLGIPSGFAIVAQDITEQRRLEDALRSSEERLRLAAEAGAMGMWEEVLDDGIFVADNQFLSLSGLPPDESVHFEDVLSKVHPDDRDQLQQLRRRVLETEGGCEFEFEYRVPQAPNGSTRWVECHGRITESRTEPRRKRVFGVLHDTTKRHRTDEFRRLAAGIIAHDLRSPLSAIKLMSQLLIERERLPEKVVHRLRHIAQKVDSMEKMVSQLLLYTQAQFGGGLPLEKEPTDLEQVCRDAIADVEASHADAEIRLKIQGNCWGVWDKTRLTEAVSNLVVNAVKHGAPGQPIYVGASDQDDEVVLKVHNLGPPIPTDLMPLIFEPFSREKKQPMSGEGSFGLGLYIVRESVSAHGGTVEVKSSLETGTTFTVRLPRGATAHDSPTA